MKRNPQMRRPQAMRLCRLAIIAAAFCVTQALAASPDEFPLRIDPPSLNFQQTWRGQAPEGRIRLVNISERTIEIRRLKTECECISLGLDGPTEMPPDGLLELTVTYATLREAAGLTKKTVTISYEDDGEKNFDIPVAIDIRPGIIFEPTFISFGPIRRGQKQTRQLLLHTPNDIDFAIGKAETSHPEVINTDFSREEHTRLQPQHQLDVTIGPLDEPGRFSGSVVLYTQHWSDTELEIPVFAEVVGPLAVEPTTIYRGKVTRGAVVEETLKLEGWPAGSDQLHVAPETDALRPLSPELVPVDGRTDRILLRLSVPDNVAGNTLSGKLILHAGDEDEPLARLTVFLYLPPKKANP